MIQVDRSRLKAEWRNIDFHEKLPELLEKVALLKPLAKFSVSDKDVGNKRYRDDPNDHNEEWKFRYFIKRVRVYQNGERIGSIGIGERHRARKYEDVYEVEGFRISKFRGNAHVTQTHNIKQAISTAKKILVPREDDELKTLISSQIATSLNTLHGHMVNAIRWDFSVEQEICNYAVSAYLARRKGDKVCNLPATPTSVRNIAEHDKKCDKFMAIDEIYQQMKAKKGYGIKTHLDKSLAVYDFETESVARYGSFDDLPEHIASKYAVFHVLEDNEPQPSVGVKFPENYCYIVS